MPDRASLKKAEILSTVGAGILGAGVGLLLHRWLAPAAVALAGLGVLCHGFGMYLRRRLESDASPRPAWETWLYWLCWIGLAAIAAYTFLLG